MENQSFLASRVVQQHAGVGARPRASRGHLLRLCAVLLSLVAARSGYGQAFPLKLGANQRHFVDQNNQPFLINGDTPWLLFTQLTLTEIETYLDNRQAKHLNTIQVMLNGAGPVNVANRAGVKPFADANDFTVRNEVYFDFVGTVLKAAEARGIAVIVAPAWQGYGDDPGWKSTLQANGEGKCRAFGNYLGTKFSRANHPNLLGWLLGGDHAVDFTYPYYKALAEGVKERDAGVSLSYHLQAGTVSSDAIADDWLSLNATYTYFPGRPDGNRHVYDVSNRAYDRAPVLPFYLAEALYEGPLQTNAQDQAQPSVVRRQACWSILSGSAGHIYGAAHYAFNNAGWKTTVDLPGAFDLSYLYSFFTGFEWTQLVPDRGHALVTAGYGTADGYSTAGDDYVTSARSADGRVGVAYLPPTGTGTRTLTVAMGQLSGSAAAQWFNPNTGAYTTIAGSPFANAGSRTFTTPGNNGDNANDWLLFLDARGSAPTTTAPDLIVTDVAWSPAAPATGAVVTFSATIKNQGTGPTPAGVVHGVGFFVDGAQATWSGSSTDALAPGASRTVTANGPLYTLTAGSHSVEAFVDDVNRIPNESNETNNKLTETLTAGGTTGTGGFSGVYRLVARHSGKALDVSGVSPANGAAVHQWDYVGGANQLWEVTATGNGYYKLTAQHSGKCLDVDGASAAEGAKIQQWEDNGSPAQRWQIEPTSDGYCTLAAQCSGKVLDVYYGATDNGAPVKQYGYGGGANQQWKLEQVSAGRAASTDPVPAAAQLAGGLIAYPNPSRGPARLSFSAAHAQRVGLTVYNQLGQVVHTRNVPAQAGPNDVALPALAPGRYQLRATVDGQAQRFTLKVE